MRAAFLLFVLFATALAAKGVDMSNDDCNAITPTNWNCLRSNGYEFAIVETWRGGYQYTKNIARCVKDAWASGMKHVDVYTFMCPQCRGNDPGTDAIKTMVNHLRRDNVTFGMLWVDIEQCDGCWYTDLAANCKWITAAADQAASMGIKVGIYSSVYEWKMTVGMACQSMNKYPLWYAHYDNVPAFTDSWAHQFGGWAKPSIKQYNDKGPACYSNVDVNWYPSN